MPSTTAASTALAPDVPATRAACRHARTQRRRLRRGLVVASVAVLIAGLVTAGMLVWRSTNVASRLFAYGGGGLTDMIGAGAPLAQDAQGRTNVLVFGTSQDDQVTASQSEHPAPWLTDSIQLLSLDHASNAVTMIAIPRDTWVDLPAGCAVGSRGKINAVYECGSGLLTTTESNPPGYAAADGLGAKALQRSVATVTGLTPQYWVHINYSVLVQSVDALGGIDVRIVGNGADGIRDVNLDYPGCTDTECAPVHYPHNGIYHLDGEHALALSRARADSNPRDYLDYGLDGGEFDRAANQQKVMIAIKDKATSAGTLANPVTVFTLLGTLGDNITMSFSAGEAKTLLTTAKDLPSDAMSSLSLTDPQSPALTTGTQSGQSVVIPVGGATDSGVDLDYRSVHSYIAAHLSGAATAFHSVSATPSATP